MLLNPKHSIQNLNGESSDCLVTKELINSVEITNFHNWIGEFKFQIVSSNKSAAARYRFIGEQRRIEKCEEFTRLLKGTFMMEIRITKMCKRALARKQLRVESIFAFEQD